MKKTPFIILTLVASLSISLSSASESSGTTLYPPELLTESSIDEQDATRSDTVRADTVRYDSTQYVTPQVSNNYYYRSRVWNSFFRVMFPRRYYAIINQPGYVPRHARVERHKAMRGGSYVNSTRPGRRPHRSSSTTSRGGFGNTGSTHTQTN